jgi:hypothetical protein
MVFRPRTQAVTPEGEVVDVPEGAPSPPARRDKPANDEDANRQAAE